MRPCSPITIAVAANGTKPKLLRTVGTKLSTTVEQGPQRPQEADHIAHSIVLAKQYAV